MPMPDTLTIVMAAVTTILSIFPLHTIQKQILLNASTPDYNRLMIMKLKLRHQQIWLEQNPGLGSRATEWLWANEEFMTALDRHEARNKFEEHILGMKYDDAIKARDAYKEAAALYRALGGLPDDDEIDSSSPVTTVGPGAAPSNNSESM